MSRLELKDIHIRDPFILNTGDRYYLYGTRGPTVWTEAEGFDCYISADLASWSGPFEIFRKNEDFWADRSYWAPECFPYEGAYYLLATFGSEGGRLGVQILRADTPLGPFQPHSDGPVTPRDEKCLDGTLYVDGGGTPHLVFSRSFHQAGEGQMCVVELARDLKTTVGDIRVLFRAVDAPWARPFPFAKEFGIDGDVYLSDGPFVHKTRSGQLLLLWSSFGSSGYSVGIARSATGDILGPWTHEAQPLVDGDGGHGMVFESSRLLNNDAARSQHDHSGREKDTGSANSSAICATEDALSHRSACCDGRGLIVQQPPKEGKRLLAIHAPNEPGQERPVFIELTETDDGLAVQRGDH